MRKMMNWFLRQVNMGSDSGLPVQKRRSRKTRIPVIVVARSPLGGRPMAIPVRTHHPRLIPIPVRLDTRAPARSRWA